MTVREIIEKHRTLIYIYLANLFFSLHYFLIIYTNSSFLENYFSTKIISALYAIGSIVNILLFLIAPRMLSRFGNRKYALHALLLEFLAVLGLALNPSAFWASLFFIAHIVLVGMIAFNFDIYLEETTKNENVTGELRATYLTVSNLMLIISPIIVSILARDSNFSSVYFLSALLTIPVILIVLRRLNINESAVDGTEIKQTFKTILKNKNLFFVTAVQTALQFFFAIMVIYIPLYLTDTIGFSWGELGPLFAIMLLPFVLIEIPAGWMADKNIGEKEMMVAGIAIMGICAALIPSITTKSFALWAMLLFTSRVGASLVEITTESYFFKHVGARNANVVSVFRMMRPASYAVAPIVFTILIQLVSVKNSFAILGAIVLSSLFFAERIKDTQ